MQVTLESSDGLARELRVEIPEEQVSGEVEKRLHSVARDIRLPGFRPGKVPRKVIAKRYGGQIRLEVAEELVRTSLQEALQQEELRPAAIPEIDSLEAEPGEGLRYTAKFDVFPEGDATRLHGFARDAPDCGDSRWRCRRHARHLAAPAPVLGSGR